MASWGSPTRPYRDRSNSPLSPPSPSSLPHWLRPSRSRKGAAGNARVKTALLAIACLSLGWLVTSRLGPCDDIVEVEQVSYDPASSGVLNEPSGFGIHEGKERRPGIIGSDLDGEVEDDDDETKIGKTGEPSVTGALAELHNAVSHKIQTWNPYFAKGAKLKDAASHNDTTEPKGHENNTSVSPGGETVREGVNDDERLGAKTRIGKATVLFSGNSFWERCIRTHERHDKVQGYRLHVLRQQLMDDVWSKPAYILSLLLREMSKPESERLDWLFWVDADTIILNPNVPIEIFLPPPGTEFDDVYLMYSNDWNGLNNGVFPVRVNQWAVHLFSGIVSYRHFRPKEPLTFRDQSAMNSLMQEPEFARHIVQAPQRWFNAYQGEHNHTLEAFQVRRGDLLVHFAGVGDREARMQHWLQRAEQHLDEWEVPVKSTSYSQEARDFWQDQKHLRKQNADRLVESRAKAMELMTQTGQRLTDYGDRLNDEQKKNVEQAQEKLQIEIDDGQLHKTIEQLEEAITKLTEAALPLTSAVTDSNKALLQAAHKAIFAGEKDLLANNFEEGVQTTPELTEVSNALDGLKVLVMAPEAAWNRHDITKATNTLTEARAKLQEKLDLEHEAKKQIAEAAQALTDAKLAAQLEADQYSAGKADLESTSSHTAQVSGHAAALDENHGLSHAEDLYTNAKDALAGNVAANSDVDGAVETVVDSSLLESGSEAIQPPTVVVAPDVTVTVPGPVEWVTASVTIPEQLEGQAGEVEDDGTY